MRLWTKWTRHCDGWGVTVNTKLNNCLPQTSCLRCVESFQLHLYI